jgi:hypothetical protein
MFVVSTPHVSGTFACELCVLGFIDFPLPRRCQASEFESSFRLPSSPSIALCLCFKFGWVRLPDAGRWAARFADVPKPYAMAMCLVVCHVSVRLAGPTNRIGWTTRFDYLIWFITPRGCLHFSVNGEWQCFCFMFLLPSSRQFPGVGSIST